MDDDATKQDTPAAFNKIDLSQLQGFNFGTQWTQDKSAPGQSGDRGDRPHRREEGGPGAPPRRDRRSFRKPADGTEAGEGGPPGGDGSRGPASRESGGDRRPSREPSGGRSGRAPERGRRPMREEAPYESPYFSITFYPEDTSFNALVKTVRASCRTIELFEIARTVLGKPDRFTVYVTRRDPEAARTEGAEAKAPAAPDSEATAKPAAAPPSKVPLFISVPDGLPFESEEAAVAHVLNRHLPLFFERAEVEIEPPKGNFQVVNRCGVSGELLGPPNYHRYGQIVQQHFAAKIRTVSFDAYRARIETVRDPEVIKQWLEKMKRTVRFTWKSAPAPVPAVAPAPAPAEVPAAAPAEAPPSAEAAPAVPAASAPPVQEAPPAPFFDSIEDARAYLLSHLKDRVVRTAASARFHGRELTSLPAGEIRRAVEGALERQRRFPLDTANALRGRLRRERFTIFKKGSKGVSYVCAVKRKFRVPGQALAQSIDALIGFIETHSMVKAGDLPKLFLGVPIPEDGAGASSDASAALAQVLTVEQREKLGRLQADLLWLVREGYVTEFIDGTLYAPPPLPEARKKEAEAEELDPENFPEAKEEILDSAAEEAAEITPPPPDAAEAVSAPEAGPELPPPEPL